MASLLFLVLAPISIDTYNTFNQRGFLDLMLRGNPYALASGELLTFRGETWPLDWPYPPLVMLLVLPAWSLFRFTHSEQIYQFVFKLPFFLAAVATQMLLDRMTEEVSNSRGRKVLARLFLINPGVVLLTTIAGGFEAVAAFLVLMAVYVFSQGRRATSALMVGIAGALRLYPLALVPLYLVHLWQGSERRTREVTSFALLSAAPLVLSCLPFLALDRVSFLAVLAGQQGRFGPFATINFATPLLRRILRPAGFLPDFQTVGYLFIFLTVLALVCVYIWATRHPLSLIRGNLLVLLAFFLFYPKVHGLYTISLLPLALAQSKKIASWVWAPGTLWMLLVNGAFGATGLHYWFAPLTGVWKRLVQVSLDPLVTTLLSSVQALVIAGAIIETALWTIWDGQERSTSRRKNEG